MGCLLDIPLRGLDRSEQDKDMAERQGSSKMNQRQATLCYREKRTLVQEPFKKGCRVKELSEEDEALAVEGLVWRYMKDSENVAYERERGTFTRDDYCSTLNIHKSSLSLSFFCVHV